MASEVPNGCAVKKTAIRRVDKDKNCQAKIYYTKQKKCKNIDSKSQIARNYDKNCQENKNNVMQSVTNKDYVQFTKPAVPYEYRGLCKDKNCQSTRCYKSPVIPVYKYDKNFQL